MQCQDFWKITKILLKYWRFPAHELCQYLGGAACSSCSSGSSESVGNQTPAALRTSWFCHTCCTEMEPSSSQPPYISDVRLDLFIILWFRSLCSFIWSQTTEINSLVMAILCLCVTPSHPLLLFFLLLLDPPLPSGSGVGFHLCVEAQLSAITLGLHLHKLARKY